MEKISVEFTKEQLEFLLHTHGGMNCYQWENIIEDTIDNDKTNKNLKDWVSDNPNTLKIYGALKDAYVKFSYEQLKTSETAKRVWKNEVANDSTTDSFEDWIAKPSSICYWSSFGKLDI